MYIIIYINSGNLYISGNNDLLLSIFGFLERGNEGLSNHLIRSTNKSFLGYMQGKHSGIINVYIYIIN